MLSQRKAQSPEFNGCLFPGAKKKKFFKKLLLNVFTVILLSYHSSFGWKILKNFKMLQVTALIR